MDSKEKLKIKGEYKCFKLASDVREGDGLIQLIRKYIKLQDGGILGQIMASGKVFEVKEATNLIPTTGLSVLARILSGDTTYTGEVDWGALGSSSTAFTSASTELGAEVYRKQASSQAFDGNIAYVDWFIANGDVANQTFNEFGAFIDGSASADSGQAWSLLSTGGWVKSGSIFISAKYTLNN